MSKTRRLVSNPLAENSVDPSKYPCDVCKKGVGKNLIFCHHCKNWIHHRCSNIKGRLRPDPNFKCKKCCQGREITPAPQLKHINIGNDKLEVIRSFCYLWDLTSKSGGCYSAIILRIRSALKKFHEPIHIVYNKSLFLVSRGHQNRGRPKKPMVGQH